MVSGAVPRWIAQASKTCAGVLFTRLAMAVTDRVFQQVRLTAVPQGREGLKHDAVYLCNSSQVPTREGTDEIQQNDRGLILAASKISFVCSKPTSDNPNSLTLAFVDEAFQCPPCIQQCYRLVVNHLAAGISGILLVAGLEGKGGVDEIEIDEVELEFLETGLESGFDALGTMIGIPELGDNKNVVPLNLPLRKNFLHRVANLFFGSVTFRSVEQAKPCLERRFGCSSSCDRVGNGVCPKPSAGMAPDPLLSGIFVSRRLSVASIIFSLDIFHVCCAP